jgi:hypothetical protein
MYEQARPVDGSRGRHDFPLKSLKIWWFDETSEETVEISGPRFALKQMVAQ